ncbi:hypothetical protein GOP47_0001498 [Adiantum capillus-veneris]|uniref:B30.2/SPRY domain-containing protein n=1 Tax=Adiantum capillus-veneris TaxID=13818 RepID=A0A9D4V956_ADICA|nr:hypothetical protein GOP47_0001498 [Adiantum capillus-veneris]
MKETSPSQRVTANEDLTAYASLCSSLGAEDDREGADEGEIYGCEGEAWSVQTRDRHDFLEVTPSFDAPAPAPALALPADGHPEESDVNESSPCERLHLANELDEASPAIDAKSPEAFNEDEGPSTVLLDVVGETDKKRRLCSIPSNGHGQVVTVVKKARKRPVNVWAKTSSRKGVKKNTKNGPHSNSKSATLENSSKEDFVCITLATKHQVKIEDGPSLPVVLSELQKAEKIVLSDDKLSARNVKGYRMVRATRGVVEGAWYFEVLVENLGPSGHTRDVDGSKVHMAVREPYGQPYRQGDVIGFYINLPNGAELAPKPPTIVSHRGQPYILEEKEDPLEVLPGSEIAFFRNGVFQGFHQRISNRRGDRALLGFQPHNWNRLPLRARVKTSAGSMLGCMGCVLIEKFTPFSQLETSVQVQIVIWTLV